jgi:hypothetical protein
MLELVQPFPAVTHEMLYDEQALEPCCRDIAERVEAQLDGYSW